MLEHEGTLWGSCDDEIAALVAAARRNGELTFTELQEVKLVTDPEQAATRPDYVRELQWTFWWCFRNRAFVEANLGERDEWHNLVPELEELRGRLLQEFESLDHTNPSTVLDWLVRLVPATWYNTLSADQAKHIQTTLAQCSKNYHGWRRTKIEDKPDDHDLQGYFYVRCVLHRLSHTIHSPWGDWLDGSKAWLKAAS